MKHSGPAIPAPSMLADSIALPPIVDDAAWRAAHAELLIEEKRLLKARDALVAKRRRMPMTPVRSGYRFLRAGGETVLLGLFDGRRQLIVYLRVNGAPSSVSPRGCAA